MELILIIVVLVLLFGGGGGILGSQSRLLVTGRLGLSEWRQPTTCRGRACMFFPMAVPFEVY
jgi:hypothetical protein